MRYIRWRRGRFGLDLPHVTAYRGQAELRQINGRCLRIRLVFLQIATHGGDAEIRRLDIGEGCHVFITRNHPGTWAAACRHRCSGYSRCSRCSRCKDSLRYRRRSQLDFLDLRIQSLNDGNSPSTL